MAYDPAKAQAYNQLKQATPFVSNAVLFQQAGISVADQVFYSVSPLGFLIQNPSPIVFDAAPINQFLPAFNAPRPVSQGPVPFQGTTVPTNIFSNPTMGPAPVNEGQAFNRATNQSIISTITANPVSPTLDPQARQADQSGNAFVASTNQSFLNAIQQNPVSGTPTSTLTRTQSQQLVSDQVQLKSQGDWRLRLSLARDADCLYRHREVQDDLTHILRPLRLTDGIIFPYTPTIQMSYNANYEPTELVHTNYRLYNYRNSNVGEIVISADFTAQDTLEANYLLAVMHFFRSVTKMFYGKDTKPPAGVPPPLCFLTGYGQYGLDQHPVVVSTFSYTLPNDVDYIKAGVVGQTGGQNLAPTVPKVQATAPSSTFSNWIASLFRLNSSGLQPGAGSTPPKFSQTIVSNPTYVPTKIQLQFTLLPITSRWNMSKAFSVQKYANGSLLKGSVNGVGGMW